MKATVDGRLCEVSFEHPGDHADRVVKELFDRIQRLSNPDRLRLAAELLEQGDKIFRASVMAKDIVERVLLELRLAQLQVEPK
jgi:hypothetical protein